MKYPIIFYVLGSVIFWQTAIPSAVSVDKNVFDTLQSSFVQTYSEGNPFAQITSSFALFADLQGARSDTEMDANYSQILIDATECAKSLLYHFEQDGAFPLQEMVRLHSLYRQQQLHRTNINDVSSWGF